MMPGNELGQIMLPALRSRMGRWWYYASVMKMSDIAERISIATEIHQSESLQDLLQRHLSDRATGIADYLIGQDQRFFNSLVIGTYGGDPKWHEVSIRNTPSTLGQEFPTQLEGMLGLLVLDGNEKLFAIDGQHRVAGIRKAVKRNQELWEEEVSVIFVAGVTQDHRQDDPEGFERTRRLFTTLNRYAKPVSKMDRIALDEDDSVAIVSRYAVEDHPLFIGKISLGQGNNIHPSDLTSFTTIGTVYDSLDKYLQTGARRSWNQFKRFRPSDDRLYALRDQGSHFWDTYCQYFPELQSLRESSPGDNVAAEHRNTEGGHLLFRPIGLLTSVYVVRDLMDSMRISVEDAVCRIANVPMKLDHKMWSGLVWDATNKRMIATTERKSTARKLMFHAAGGDLTHLKSDGLSLRKELAGLLNKDEQEIRLERIVEPA